MKIIAIKLIAGKVMFLKFCFRNVCLITSKTNLEMDMLKLQDFSKNKEMTVCI